MRLLLILVVIALGLSMVFSFGVVLSQNPHASTRPLYGPSDFVNP